MAGEDILQMSQKELKRLHIIQKRIDGQIGQEEAARMLRMSVRHVRRMAKRVMLQGAARAISRRRGKVSNRAVSIEERQRVLGLYRQKYWDFGPTLAVEKLR
ncbi:MAG TPA: helix-turn-helix domain-containing protein [Dissulfurispiraceae bacterium]|nr:helix-turn-helix domain-containing protein [Dissulfurispiraceae bacterium]